MPNLLTFGYVASEWCLRYIYRNYETFVLICASWCHHFVDDCSRRIIQHPAQVLGICHRKSAYRRSKSRQTLTKVWNLSTVSALVLPLKNWAICHWFITYQSRLRRRSHRQCRPRTDFCDLLKYKIAGSLLPFSTTLKLLGVTFDSHLSFKEHSASIIKSCNHLIWSIRHIRPLLSVDTTSALAVLFSLAWITAIPFSMVHLPLWSIPCSAYKTNSLNLSFSTQPSIALTAWRNCTGYRSIIASSSKSLSWHIELSRHPIHPISNTFFSAVIHLVFAHLPPFNYTNQFTNHPSSTEASRMPLLLSGMPYLPK